MRLPNPSKPNHDPSALNADLLEHILGVAERKRTRSSANGRANTGTSDRKIASSSLQFKAEEGQEYLTSTLPRTNKQKNQQQQAEQQQPQQQQPRRIPIATRARGSSGIPPHRLDLSDLEGMTEEELMQALYKDPELAEAAAQAASTSKQQQQQPSTSKSKRRSTISSYPAHVQDRMEGGVPIFQWIIVLFLMGIGLYQLFKVLTVPPPRKGSKAAVKGSTSNSKGKRANKGNSQKGMNKTKTAPRKTPKAPISSAVDGASKVKQDATPAEDSTTSDNNKKKAGNTRKSKKSKEATTPAIGIAKVSSSAGNASKNFVSESMDSGVQRETSNMVDDDDDDGWQPVGKKNKGVKKAKASTAFAKTTEDPNLDVIAEVKNAKEKNLNETVQAIQGPEVASEPSEIGQGNRTDNLNNKSKVSSKEENYEMNNSATISSVAAVPETTKRGKKKSKKKNASKADAINATSTSTTNQISMSESPDADAALASQLQQEEQEILLQANGQQNSSHHAAHEETWEEVSRKRGKRKHQNGGTTAYQASATSAIS